MRTRVGRRPAGACAAARAPAVDGAAGVTRAGRARRGGGAARAGRALAWLLALAWAAPAAARAQEARILSDVPASVDPAADYLIYLHGRIIEVRGRRPTHPAFGVYEYDAILRAFAEHGFVVISEARPADTRIDGYARKVAGQVRRLIEAGVPPAHITVVGFSKGGMITVAASSLLKLAGVRYVVLAGCTSGVLRDERLALTGRVLSIHEASDNIGLSCAPLFARSPGAGEKREIEISTGLRHGAFYRPRAEWLDPIFAWLRGERSSRREGVGGTIPSLARAAGAILAAGAPTPSGTP